MCLDCSNDQNDSLTLKVSFFDLGTVCSVVPNQAACTNEGICADCVIVKQRGNNIVVFLTEVKNLLGTEWLFYDL